MYRGSYSMVVEAQTMTQICLGLFGSMYHLNTDIIICMHSRCVRHLSETNKPATWECLRELACKVPEIISFFIGNNRTFCARSWRCWLYELFWVTMKIFWHQRTGVQGSLAGRGEPFLPNLKSKLSIGSFHFGGASSGIPVSAESLVAKVPLIQ